MGTPVVKPMNEVELASVIENILPLFNVTVTVPPATFPVRSVRKKKPPTDVTLLLVKLKIIGSNSWKVDSHVSPVGARLKKPAVGAVALELKPLLEKLSGEANV